VVITTTIITSLVIRITLATGIIIIIIIIIVIIIIITISLRKFDFSRRSLYNLGSLSPQSSKLFLKKKKNCIVVSFSSIEISRGEMQVLSARQNESKGLL